MFRHALPKLKWDQNPLFLLPRETMRNPDFFKLRSPHPSLGQFLLKTIKCKADTAWKSFWKPRSQGLFPGLGAGPQAREKALGTRLSLAPSMLPRRNSKTPHACRLHYGRELWNCNNYGSFWINCLSESQARKSHDYHYHNLCQLYILIPHPKGTPPYRSGMVFASQWPLELCRLESCTPGRATHAEQVEG